MIDLLRLQTVRPFIIVVDTGSDETHSRRIEALRTDDVEVHALRLNAIENSSEVVSMAMDTIQGLCRTRFLFCTHDDVFLRSRSVLKELRDLAAEHRVAGHRLTRRPHDDWHEMFGHSVLMLDNDFAIDHGLTWNMRRGVRLFGIKRPVAVPKLANWPDTETGLNYLCRLAGIKPVLTGDEKNWARNVDDWIDHCRSSAGGAIYRPDHYEKAKEWLAEAMREGWQRVRQWGHEPVSEEPPLADEAPTARLTLPHFTPGNY